MIHEIPTRLFQMCSMLSLTHQKNTKKGKKKKNTATQLSVYLTYLTTSSFRQLRLVGIPRCISNRGTDLTTFVLKYQKPQYSVGSQY